MKLNIPERLILVNSIVDKGSFATLKMIEEVKGKLYLSEEETEKYEVKQIGDDITWNSKAIEPLEFKFSKGQKEFIIKSLKSLDEKEIATSAHFALYKKFTENKE